MSNKRNNWETKNEQETKHKYRLNKKKFAVTLALLCFFAAVVLIAAYYLKNYDEKEVIAGVNVPQQTFDSQATETGTPTAAGISGKIIVVDAGHGGFDPGAVGVEGSHEAKINLIVAKYLKTELESTGAQVIMTREEDDNGLGSNQNESLAERRRIIEQSGSEIVVSVHMNSFPDDPNVSGPLVMFMSGSENGKKLAQAIINSMNENLEPKRDGKARAENDKYILKSGFQPCVIVECGYLSNAEEEEKLNTDEYQREVAKAICRGVEAYFR